MLFCHVARDQSWNKDGAALLLDLDEYQLLRHDVYFYIINIHHAICMPKKAYMLKGLKA